MSPPLLSLIFIRFLPVELELADRNLFFLGSSFVKVVFPVGILTWTGGYGDHKGRSPRARLFHCTSVELTPRITPNVGNSTS